MAGFCDRETDHCDGREVSWRSFRRGQDDREAAFRHNVSGCGLWDVGKTAEGRPSVFYRLEVSSPIPCSLFAPLTLRKSILILLFRRIVAGKLTAGAVGQRLEVPTLPDAAGGVITCRELIPDKGLGRE